MLSLAQNIWWPYIHRDILAKASECNACTENGKNLKSVIPHCKRAPLPKCVEPNDEIQIDFGGPKLYEKGIEQYFITSLGRYSMYLTAEIINNASGTNVIKTLNKYKENNITPIYAPAIDHRAIGLVERLIQTIKRQLSCMKTQLNKNLT